MTIWEQLGIEATKDIAAIRSAYAARAKELHPEEHPEEFQQLQAAYKAAVKSAKRGAAAVRVAKDDDLAVQSGEERTEQAGAEEKEQTFDYDYQEIREGTLSEQFFQEFFYIAWNPWLLNNRVCWDLFLHRPQYRELFEDGDFRKNLVRTMCYVSGWHRNTIRYFDVFLKTFQKAEETKPETEYFRWRLKKKRPWNKGFVTTEKWITKEQKDLQNILLSAVQKEIGFFPQGKKEAEGFFKDRKAVEFYLRVYLNYARKHSRRLEKMYRANCGGKSFMRALFLVLLFWFFLIAYINLTGDFPKRQTEQEMRQEEWDKERMDNIKKYLEE